MATKWDGEETAIAAETVGSDVIALASTPDTIGPFTLRGAPPPELRDLERIWIRVDESDNATVYQSLADAKASRSPVDIASWALELDFDSLTATAATVATTASADTIATLGTPLSVSAVTNGADSLTITGHGLAVDAGPFHIASSGAVPAGTAANTPYWIRAVADANTVTLAASKGGPVVNLTDDGSGTITLTPVNVYLDTNSLYSLTHGLTTGTLVRLTTSGALPTGLSTGTNYWIIAVSADELAFASSLANALAGTKVDLTAVGSGTTTILRCNVDTTTDTLRTASAHGFVTGDGPLRLTTDGALPTGLATATDYYVIAVDADELKLAATKADAVAETPVVVDITAIGSGTQTLTLAGVDVTDNTIRVAAHGMQTGDGPVTCVTGGSLPTGLAADTDYWVIRADANYVKLATSRANALAGTDINITAIGSGDHGLARALEVGKDLTADGIVEWLAQGVSRAAMVSGAVEDVEAIFV